MHDHSPTPLILVLALVCFGVAFTATSAPGAAGAPPSGKIVANFPGPPTTFYRAEITDTDTPADQLQFDWSGTTINCGSWEPVTPASKPPNSGADWYHGAGVGDLDNKASAECSHAEGTTNSNHVGHFTVRVTDNTGNQIVCTIDGVLSGEQQCTTSTSSPSPSLSTSPGSVDLCVKVVAIRANQDPGTAVLHDSCQDFRSGETRLVDFRAVEYHYTVTNLDPSSTASNVVLTDKIGAAVPDTRIVGSSAPCESSDETDLRCPLGSLGPGASIESQVAVQRGMVEKVTDLTNRARVATSSFDRDSANNEASVSVTIDPNFADVTLDIEAPAASKAGEKFPATVTLKNRGPGPALGVLLKINPSDDVESLDLSRRCNEQSRSLIFCRIGKLAKGEEVKERIVFKDGGRGPRTVTLEAVSSSRTDDNNPDNNAGVRCKQSGRCRVTVRIR